jgi:hypothetical protein
MSHHFGPADGANEFKKGRIGHGLVLLRRREPNQPRQGEEVPYGQKFFVSFFQKRSAFFFEKKETKNFYPFGSEPLLN